MTASSSRIGRVIVVVAALALLVGASPFAARPAAAAGPAPKVVLIVGPAGAATARYRDLAEEAAVAAAKRTPNVVRVYSPDATWPAVKQALAGASIVVYLGHGNGWPSPYRDQLTGSTQNGLGLNPHAGAADVHQYFGEDRLAAEVDLAKNAVVVLSHLCYASGNSEPGLPEGPLEVGQQRVDNYAAGFLRAGASAVIADAHHGPAWYVDAILRGKGTLDGIWRGAPSVNGNYLAYDSVRSPGHLAQMDPDTADSGFHRSFVARPGLTAAQVLAGARGGGPEIVPYEQTLAGLGITFGAADLATPPTAGASTALSLPLHAANPDLVPSALLVATRWDVLEGSEAPPGGPDAPPAAPDLVVAERPGEVVAPTEVERTKDGLRVAVRVPSHPGLYRLVPTLHGADGVAYDAATQALLPALVVRVTGSTTASYAAPAAVTARSDEPFVLDVAVTNLGARAWGRAAIHHRIGQAETEPASRALLVARWVDLGGLAGGGEPAPTATTVLPAGLAAGAAASIALQLAAPSAPGEYLLVLDVVVPRTGSLAADGVPPGIVRVSVGG